MDIREKPLPEMDGVKKTAIAYAQVKKEYPDLEQIDMSIGVFHDPLAGGTQEAWYQLAEVFAGVESSTGYNFEGDSAFLESQKKLVFGEDTGKVEAVPASGGSDAISQFNGVSQSLVPVGVPTWPGHKRLIESAGGIYVPFSYLDAKGEVDVAAFRDHLDPDNVREIVRQNGLTGLLERLGMASAEMQGDTDSFGRVKDGWLNSKSVTPLIQAICHNPLGVDIPEKHWEAVANELADRNIVLQVDLAYLGLGEGIEEDLRFVRFLKQKGVKMAVEFSDSKFHAHYSHHRVGSLLLVNFEPGDKMREKLLNQRRNTTSAHAVAGQRISHLIETDDEIRGDQRESNSLIRRNANANRKVIGEALPAESQQFSKNAKGPFLFAPDSDGQSILPFIHPELAENLGMAVPAEAQDFPKDQRRIVAVPSNPKDGAGLGGTRLSIASVSQDDASEAQKTVRRAYEAIASTKPNLTEV